MARETFTSSRSKDSVCGPLCLPLVFLVGDHKRSEGRHGHVDEIPRHDDTESARASDTSRPPFDGPAETGQVCDLLEKPVRWSFVPEVQAASS